jgi:cobalamin transport system substrate-binding protein
LIDRWPPWWGVVRLLAAILAPGACARRSQPPSADVAANAPLAVASVALSGPVRSHDASADASCSYPITTRDRRGVLVTLQAPAQRIVSLLPSHTETLFALGVGAAVVGVDDYSATIVGAAGLPRLGGLYDARAEPTLALRPDLAFVSETSRVASMLGHAGVPTWGGSAAKFDEIAQVIESTAALVCHEKEGALLVGRMIDDVAAVERRAAGLMRVKVYYELDASLYTVGPESFIGTMIAKAGGQDIAPQGIGDFPKISSEAIVAADPAVIFGVGLDEARSRPGWTGITAVREGRAYKLSAEQSGLVARPGPRIAEGLRILFEYIHPEAVP